MSTSYRYTTPDLAQLPLTVYYDHSCLVCRSEIENLAARDTRGVLKMMDCSGNNFDTSALPFDQPTLLGCIHAIDSKGEWLKATDVFVVCYRAAHMRRIATVLILIKPLLERLYPWIAKHRHWLTALGISQFFKRLSNSAIQRQSNRSMTASQACKDGSCEALKLTQKPT